MTYAKEVEHRLEDFVPSASEDVRAMQEAARARLLQALTAKVSMPLERLVGEEAKADVVRQKLDGIVSELDRIDAALEKLPSLGLVMERGRG